MNPLTAPADVLSLTFLPDTSKFVIPDEDMRSVTTFNLRGSDLIPLLPRVGACSLS